MAKSGDARRVPMVEREVQQAIARFVGRDLKDEVPGLLTITQVKMPADLRSARVSVSLFVTEGDEAEIMKDVLKTLKAWAPEIQAHLNHELKMRYVPKLSFEADQSMAKTLQIENLLRDIKKNEPK
ncbi:MAG: 30S ribosome-binding factor RbfA [Bdellovibrionaceae bacterium]|nr:30S ribosome-binding factor RbfA [Pseudobdellovibrionaceae bacterium]